MSKSENKEVVNNILDNKTSSSEKTENNTENKTENNTVKLQKLDKLFVAVAVIFLFFSAIIVWRQIASMHMVLLVEALVGFAFMALATYTDIKKNIIPNKLILAMLGVVAGFKLVDIIVLGASQTVDVMLSAVGGGAFALFVFGAVYLITKKQLGGGDVKLATVMGLFLTSERVVGGIVYGLIICALFSFVMLILKKLGKKDTVPLAPFLTIGYAVSLLFVF